METDEEQFEKVRSFIHDDLKIDCSMLEIGKTSWIRIQNNNITKISTTAEKEIKGLDNLTQLEYLDARYITEGISLNELPNQMNILIGIVD